MGRNTLETDVLHSAQFGIGFTTGLDRGNEKRPPCALAFATG